jgi:tape measure domain-containing protein
MAQDLERLVVSLEASIKKYESTMARAAGITDKQMRAIEKRTQKSMGVVGENMALAAKAFVGGAALKGAQTLIDTSTRIDNALKVAGVSGEQLNQVYAALYESAQKNAAPLESLVQLYGRASLVQKELGISSQELLKFTDNVAVALRVSGKSAQESAGALLQLSQALGSGTVRAEEFNSILEGALPIAQAAAKGIDEAGGSVAKLRQLVVDGKVSSTAFFKGFEAGASTLKDQVANSTYTIAQGFTRLENAAVDAAKRINDAAGASRSAISVLDGLAFVVNKLGDAFAYLAARAKQSKVADDVDDLGAAARNLWNNPSFQNLYEFLFDTSKSRSKAAASDAIDAQVRGLDQLKKAMSAANAEADKAKAKSTAPNRFDEAFAAFANKKIKLSDYPTKPKTSDSDAADLDAFERRLAMTQRQIALMGVEAATIDQTAAARDRARVVVDLETAAREANRKAGEKNTEVTAKQREQIEKMADAYAKARAQVEAMHGPLATYARESANLGDQLQHSAVNGLRGMEDALVDVVMGTKSAADAFKTMANAIIADLARIMIRKAITGPIAGLFGGGSAIGGLHSLNERLAA